MPTALRLLTRNSANAMIEARNSAAWYAKEATVRSADFFVCVRPGTRDPFFIAKITSVEPVPDSGANRWALMFSEYAQIDSSVIDIRSKGEPERSQNPVFKFDLDSALKMPIDQLEWKTAGDRTRLWSFSEEGSSWKVANASSPSKSLTILEAKRLLALSHGVRPDQIEIIIRG